MSRSTRLLPSPPTLKKEFEPFLSLAGTLMDKANFGVCEILER